MKPVRVINLLSRRGRSGQSIIILAFALIMMLGFVGIATDVALLFVRYNSLRRAVDAAAIAAAGQLRENADYYALNSIAKEFIQLHGINPSSVKVDTCETEVADYMKVPANAAYATSQAAAQVPPLTAGQWVIKYYLIPNVPDTICSIPPKKLVRVSVQFPSATAFMSLLGFKTITLEANAVSQTASLDVVIALDTSISMALDTRDHQTDTATYPSVTYLVKQNTTAPEQNNAVALANFHDFTNRQPETLAEARGTSAFGANVGTVWGVGVGTVNAAFPDNNKGLTAFPAASIVKTDITDGAVYIDSAAADALVDDTSAIRWECWYNPLYQPQASYGEVKNKANYAWAGCCNDPTVQSDTSAGATTFNPISAVTDNTIFNPDPNWYVYDDQTFTESVIMTHGYNPFVDFTGAGNVNNKKAAAKVVSGGHAPSGKNIDALGDGNYSDLLCRPFKDVKDSARRFIRRLDFGRGDRIVLVTFDSEPRAIKPYGQNLEIITDANVAVQTLNMKVGVEVAPNNLQVGCHTKSVPGAKDWGDFPVASRYYPNANPNNVVNYWTAVQCVDTNTGGGIALATQQIIDPKWIRRDSVWVMVLLSDGYPNRTPPLASGGIGGVTRDWAYETDNPQNISAADLAIPLSNLNSAAQVQDVSNPTIAKYCDPVLDADGNPTNPDYGTKPQYCAAALEWGWKGTDRLRSNEYGVPAVPPAVNDYGVIAAVTDPVTGYTMPQFSFGFCPTWTYCTAASGNCNTDGENPAVSSYFYSHGINSSWAICTSADPDARHFCMDPKGQVNTTTPSAAYQCDPQYDATDYARDRMDYAALLDYTAKQKGNFIATYAIFFNHNTSTALRDNILGVKFMRYAADAGDNGKIDNPIQRWYRDERDGTICTPIPCSTYNGVNPPPTGGFAQAVVNGVVPSVIPGLSGQDVLPDWSATNPLWTVNYGYELGGDPCAVYDYYYNDGAEHYLNETDPGDVTLYTTNAKAQCGQYYFVNNASGLRKAFIEIAGRLFTRLTR